jgi:hypothetical protein
MKKLLMAVALAAVTISTAQAQTAGVLRTAWGIIYSCRDTKGPEAQLFMMGWVLGFWTAFNSLNPGAPRVGESAGGAAIWDMVLAECDRNPASNLEVATVAVYNRLVHVR